MAYSLVGWAAETFSAEQKGSLRVYTTHRQGFCQETFLAMIAIRLRRHGLAIADLCVHKAKGSPEVWG
jgi:hypothetical protein